VSSHSRGAAASISFRSQIRAFPRNSPKNGDPIAFHSRATTAGSPGFSPNSPRPRYNL
jgi:hypothetical protein